MRAEVNADTLALDGGQDDDGQRLAIGMPGFGTQTGSRKSPSPLMSSLALSERQVAHGAVANFRRRKAHPHVDGRASSAYLTATPRARLGNEVSAIGSLGEIPLVSQRSRWGIV